MAKIVECVPNFSEGRRPEVIAAICDAISAEDGVTILDKEMDASHNRAVVTFACDPKLAVDAAFRGYQKAAELIDMTRHQGGHPRMGACDVCPFIPLGETTEEEAIELAQKLGKRVGEELGIPVFLYESAASTPSRRNLAKVRQGQYEGMIEALGTDKKRIPDYGPNKMNLKSGATAIGVRFPLVAYNVYLGSNDLEVAQKIADAVRSIKGGYRFVKAMGIEIKERNQVQISMNLVHYVKTPIFRVFETIKSEAARYGINVTSSEIVGLVPNQAMLDVADFYLRLEHFSREQVLEEKLADAASGGGATGGSSFYDDVASSSPAPGGGSVAASAGALGAALSAMVCRLTVGKKAYAAVKDELGVVRDQADALLADLTKLINTDKAAFDAVMEAFKLPKGSDELDAVRNEGIQTATKTAANVPLEVMQKSLEVLKLARIVAEKGNQNSITDAGVAALMARSAVEGASYNVRINLTSIDDKEFVAKLARDEAAVRQAADTLAADIKKLVEAAL
ncbi:MAG: glutamate formimidoyltransferase [candidate division Zixibacteria bacterium]|nr:glutamate formimidoyltransferase [candidate division Zixibacteria bacterium]